MDSTHCIKAQCGYSCQMSRALVIPWGIREDDTGQADEGWDIWDTVVTSWNSSYSPMAPEMAPNPDA